MWCVKGKKRRFGRKGRRKRKGALQGRGEHTRGTVLQTTGLGFVFVLEYALAFAFAFAFGSGITQRKRTETAVHTPADHTLQIRPHICNKCLHDVCCNARLLLFNLPIHLRLYSLFLIRPFLITATVFVIVVATLVNLRGQEVSYKPIFALKRELNSQRIAI